MDEFALPAKKPRLTGAHILSKRMELNGDSTSQRPKISVPGSYMSINPTSTLLALHVLPTATLPTSIGPRYSDISHPPLLTDDITTLVHITIENQGHNITLTRTTSKSNKDCILSRR